MLIYCAQLRRCILEDKTITLKFSRLVTNKHGETFFNIFFYSTDLRTRFARAANFPSRKNVLLYSLVT
jgi:hypothetical protein